MTFAEAMYSAIHVFESSVNTFGKREQMKLMERLYARAKLVKFTCEEV